VLSLVGVSPRALPRPRVRLTSGSSRLSVGRVGETAVRYCRIVLSFDVPNLRAHGVVLRKPHRSDMSWLIDACNRPEINRVSPDIPYPYGAADARAFVDRAERVWQAETHTPFVIEREHDAEPLGVIELHLGDRSAGIAWVSAWLRQEARGGGVATSALRRISSWAFEGVGVEWVYLVTPPENIAAQRVAVRAGFVQSSAPHPLRPDRVFFTLSREDNREPGEHRQVGV
jgi:RimJ/RimL family protein N-acetyltransferase